MQFTKMHGIGNDYVYVNCFEEQVDDPAPLAKAVSDRHFGIGSDGLILICPSNIADVRMRMFNADGSESQMCGNGIRCVAKYAYDHKLVRTRAAHFPYPAAQPIPPHCNIETGNGVLKVGLDIKENDKVQQVCVKWASPSLKAAAYPSRWMPQQLVNVPFEDRRQNAMR